MILEGKNSVYEAIVAEKTINKLYAENNLKDPMSNKIIDVAKQKGIFVNFVPKQTMDKLSKTQRHQGFIAEVTDFEYCEISDIFENAKNNNHSPFIVMLDGIEDPHNMGAIIRSCECLGVDGIIIPEHRSCPVNETVIKTSAGATHNMKIARETNLNQTIEKLKKNGVWVYGVELGGNPIEKTKLDGSICLVVGSEGKGISALVKKNCDDIVTLSMKGKINSLNASVAAGIAIYEASKLR